MTMIVSLSSRSRPSINFARCRGSLEDGSPCRRRVLWAVAYIGGYCGWHFEQWATTHAFDPVDIRRLSDDERHFVSRAEPGKGHSGKRPPIVEARA